MYEKAVEVRSYACFDNCSIVLWLCS